jgi:hypothetical protein
LYEVPREDRVPIVRVTRSLVVASIALVLSATPASGQRASGTVRDSATNAGLSGAVVLALSQSGASLARTLTNGTGHYSLALPASAVQLRVLRLGFRPGTYTLPTPVPAVVSADIPMGRVTTLLTSMSVVNQPLCPASDDSRSASALWEHARAALLASVVAREALPAKATTLTFERAILPEDSLVVFQKTRTASGQTRRPFLTARTPADLAAGGYVHSTPAGRAYDVPDADVLLDESFALTHCFHVRQADGAHPGQLGLSFAPIAGRDSLVEVHGVLWFDPRQPALQSLEFGYTNLPEAALGSGVGGTLHFRTMSNGVVVIDDWLVRLAALEQVAIPVRRAEFGAMGTVRPLATRDSVALRVVQLRETGGVLLHATWPDSLSWEATLGTFAGRLIDNKVGKPLSGVIVTLQGTADSVVTDSTGQFIIRPVLPGHYRAYVIDTSFVFLVKPRFAEQLIDVRAGVSTTARFDLPERATVLTSTCTSAPDAKPQDRIATVVGRVVLPDGASTAGLRLGARWQADITIVSGTQGGATISEATRESDLEEGGRFSLCGVAQQRPVHLRLMRDKTQVADTIVRADTRFMTVDWHPKVSAP